MVQSIQSLVMFVMLFLTASGGPSGANQRHSDLLDMIPTQAYWRAKAITVSREQLEGDIAAPQAPADIAKLVKDLESLRHRDNAKKQLAAIGAPALDLLKAETKSEDPEAAAMAQQLIDVIAQHGKEHEVCRLMAIRTLGERKEKDSLPLLKSLAASKDLFVADYAARAIAQIEGSPLPPTPAVNLADDLKLLPSNTGIIGQATGLGLPGFTLETFVAQMLALTPPNGPLLAPADKDKTLDDLTHQLLDIAEAVGNVRVDGATIAVSADIGGTNNWFVFSFHGLYDREAAAAYLSKLNRNAAVVREGDMLKLALNTDSMALLPSDKQFIMVAANPGDTPLATVVDPLTAALTTGHPNTLSENKPLGDLLNTVDKTGPIWVAGIPSAKMRATTPICAAFDTIALVATRDKDTIKITATAKGAGDIPAAVAQFNAIRDSVLPKLKTLIAISKDCQPLVDAVESVKITSDEKGAAATATTTPDIAKSIIVSIIGAFQSPTHPRPAPMPPPMPPQVQEVDPPAPQ